MRLAVTIALLTAGVASGVPGHEARAQAAFSDQTASAGLTYTPEPRFDMDGRPFNCGATVGDFDRDGWPDLFVLGGGGGGGLADALFINNQDGTFTDAAGQKQEARFQYPGLPTTCDGSESVVHVETVNIAQGAGCFSDHELDDDGCGLTTPQWPMVGPTFGANSSRSQSRKANTRPPPSAKASPRPVVA